MLLKYIIKIIFNTNKINEYMQFNTNKIQFLLFII